MISTYLMIVIWTIAALISAYIAKQKGRSPAFWFCMGFLFSLISILTISLLPLKQTPSRTKREEAIKVPDSTDLHNDAQAIPNQPYASPFSGKRLPTSPSIDWYLINEKQEVLGPLRISELRSEVIKRGLGEDAYIWCEEFNDWSQIKEFQNGSNLLDKDLL